MDVFNKFTSLFMHDQIKNAAGGNAAQRKRGSLEVSNTLSDMSAQSRTQPSNYTMAALAYTSPAKKVGKNMLDKNPYESRNGVSIVE